MFVFIIGPILSSAERKGPAFAQLILEFSSRIMPQNLNSWLNRGAGGRGRKMWLSLKNKDVVLGKDYYLDLSGVFLLFVELCYSDREAPGHWAAWRVWDVETLEMGQIPGQLG